MSRVAEVLDTIPIDTTGQAGTPLTYDASDAAVMQTHGTWCCLHQHGQCHGVSVS